MIFVKSAWHNINKQGKLKVAIIGTVEDVKFKVDQFKFGFKSVNTNGFSSLIENLI